MVELPEGHLFHLLYSGEALAVRLLGLSHPPLHCSDLGNWKWGSGELTALETVPTLAMIRDHLSLWSAMGRVLAAQQHHEVWGRGSTGSLPSILQYFSEPKV